MAHTPVFTDSLAHTLLAPPQLPEAGAISFYACGITPYEPAHIGHARSFVVFDLMRQVLREGGYQVDMVRNITDIDDKIIQAAHASGQHWKALADGNAARNRREMAALGVVGYEEPQASEHIGEIIQLTERLLAKGHAYVSDTGDVLFEVGTFQGAALMPHNHEDLLSHTAGRVSSEGKRSPLDFVLWKLAKPGEPSWASPWGAGRPGWHIECSAMVEKRFGTTLDYHGGGTDLRFPHHQAEIMQSEAAFDRPLAHRWVHHGSVRDAAGKKMSKSLGNYVELTQALDQADGLLPGAGGAVLRLALLSGLWTKPLDWSDMVLAQASQHLLGWARAAGDAAPNAGAAREFSTALGHNLNTPKAYGALHALAEQARRGDHQAAGGVAYALRVLGVPRDQLESALQRQEADAPAAVVELLAARERARQARDYTQADTVRGQIAALGWRVEDSAEGPKLRRA